MALHNLLGEAALVVYAISAAAYATNLFRPSVLVGRLATGSAALGVVLNWAALYTRATHLHSVPYRDLLGSMSLLGFFLGVLNLVLESRHQERSLGPFLIAAAFLLLLVGWVVPAAPAPPRPELRGPIFALHVTLNMLAYAAFAVACALSALYLVVRRSLKQIARNAFDGPASRLPTLSYLERANRTSLGVGVVALALGLALGMVWAVRVWQGEHPSWALDPKVLMALVTLFFYAAVVLRAHRGAAPVTTARLSVAGFVLILLSYTAVNLFFSRLHTFAG